MIIQIEGNTVETKDIWRIGELFILRRRGGFEAGFNIYNINQPDIEITKYIRKEEIEEVKENLLAAREELRKYCLNNKSDIQRLK